MKNSTGDVDTLRRLVEAAQGAVHPEVLALPEEEQLLLYQDALENGVMLDQRRIDELCADLDHRLELARALCAYLPKEA